MKRYVGGVVGLVMLAGISSADLPIRDGLSFWVDAGSIDGVTNGVAVTNWPDLSANGLSLMQTATNSRPTYVTNGFNGVPAVSFSGGERMTNQTLSADWPTAAVSWFLVAKLDTVDQGNSLLVAEPDSSSRFLTHFPHSNGNFYWDYGNISGSGRLFASRNSMGTDPALWHFRAGDGAMAVLKNGGVYMQKSSNDSFNPAGKHLTLGTGFRGQVAEILVYNRVLSSSEEVLVGAYLADKYGIATTYAAPTVMPGDFAHKRRIEVTGYAGSETLTNFPVLVNFDEGGAFSYVDCASPNGHDLRFGLDGTDEQLDFEIDQWDTNGTSCVWVRIPELSNGTTFWAYWGNPGDTMLPASSGDGSTWLADYAAVWHLNEANAVDSGVNNNAGTAAGTVGVSLVDDGRIGKGVDLPGSTGVGGTGYISVPSSSSIEMGSTFSASVWVTYERNSVDQWERLLNKKDIHSATNGWEIGHQQNHDQQMFMSGSAGASATRPQMVDGWRNAQWEMITVVYDGSNVHAYANGEFKGDVPCTPVVDNSAWPFVIGNDASFNEYNWDGKIDEVRLADAVRSVDWVKAEYNVVAGNGGFLTYSDEINALPASEVTMTGATLDGELGWVSGTSDVVVCWGMNDAGMTTSGWDHVESAGAFTSATVVARMVDGLTPTTTYTYRFTAGGAWSEAVSFRTRFAEIEGLTLWWDASAISGVADGETVGEWTDWAGSGNSGMQIQPERQPAMVAVGIGGRPTLRFDGGTDGLYYDGNVIVNTDYTIFLVEHRRSTKDNNYILIGSYAVAAQNLHVGYRTYNTFTHAHYANDYNMPADVSQAPQPSIYAISFNAGERIGRRTDLNGELLGRDNSLGGLTAYGGASLGAWENTGRHYDGDIAEMIIFARGLSQSEQVEVGRYLAEKYGIDGGYDAGDADAGTYAYSADITFGGYAGGEVLTNFPVLVRLGETEIEDFAYGQFASSAGTDLRFTLQGGGAVLNHELESWDTDGTSYVWIRIPAFTNNTTITAEWGNPSLVGTSPYWQLDGAVWNDTFRGVWHLAETNFPYGDSTLNERDGMAGVLPAAASGAIGPAQVFDGATQKIDVPYAAALNPTVYSVSCWARVDGGSSYRSPVTSRRGTPQQGYVAYALGDNTWSFWQGSGTAWSQTPASAVTPGAWTHLTMVYDGNGMYFYVNGVRYGPTVTALLPNDGYPLRFGAGATEGGGQYWFNGAVDEVRVADVVRSSDWISAVYANVADYTNFVTAGVADGPGPMVEALAATLITDTNAVANGSLSTAAVPTTVWLHWGTSDAGTGAWATVSELGSYVDGPLSAVIAGLTADTTYYYRFFASNGLGTAWSSATASFSSRQSVYYTITPSSGSNGAIVPEILENLNPGEDSSVYTFVADEGYSLTNVIVDGTVALGAVASHQFTNVTASHSIQALFGISMYAMDVVQTTGGTITPDPAQVVAHGSDSELFSITAAAGYYLVDVVTDGVSQGAVTSYRFADVKEAHSLTARFAVYPVGVDNASMAFWIQADKVPAGDGERLARWPELSGHTNDLFQPVWGFQPTLVTNGFNGWPALDFDGAQSMTNVAMNADWPTSNATIFVVAKADLLGQSTHIFRNQPFGNYRFSAHLPWSNGNNYLDYSNMGDGRLFWGNAGTDMDSIWCLVNEYGVYQAAWRNGELKKSEATAGTWNPAGQRFEIGGTYQGQIAELIIFNTAMDEVDRNRVGYYLQEKYGLDTTYVDPNSADLALDMTASNDGMPVGAGMAWKQGETVSYTVNLINNGPTNASGVVVTDLIPSHLSYQSHSGGSYNPTNGEWTISGLAYMGSTSLTVSATMNMGIGYQEIVNTATVAANETDNNPGGESATVTIYSWYDDLVMGDYANRVKITFPGYTRPETLTNFPALVTLGSHISGFSYDAFESAIGVDLQFTSDDGATVIAHEIETWDTDGDSLVWVRLPELQAGTYIWAYWGRGEGIESWLSPTSTADCVLWLKAEAGVLTDGSGNVTNWLDQSGNGHALSQANAAMQPSLVSAVSALGGNPAIRFDDPADDGVGLGPVDLGIGTNDDRTVVMVAIPEANPTQGSEVIGRGTSQMLEFGTWTQNGRLRVRNGSVDAFSGQYSVRYNRPHVVVAVGSDGASVLNSWVSGEQMNINETTTAFQWPMDALYVGLSQDLPNRSYEGDLAELIVYDRALTREELNDIGMYLTAKYGIKTSYNSPTYTTDGTVWADGYSGVWHLDSTTIIGSGPNDAYGRPADPNPVAGRVGTGQEFFRLDQVECGTRASVSGAGPFAVSAWIKTRTLLEQSIFQQRDLGNTQGQLNLWMTPAGYPRFWCYENGYGFDFAATNSFVADGEWHHITAVREGTEGRLYVDGALSDTQDPGGNTKIMSDGIPCGIGRDIRDDNKPFNGTIDEVQFSDALRTTNWIWATYANQVSNATFVGAETVHGFPVIANRSPTGVSGTSAILNGELVDTGALTTSVSLYWGTADAGTGAWNNTHPLGVQAAGTLAVPVTTLSAGTTYYYRYLASNAYAIVWASPVVSFTTPSAGEYAISAYAGSGGSISPSGVELVASGGDSATYTFAAAEGYAVTNVIVDGSPQGVISEKTFTSVGGDHTIEALFGIKTYTITVTQSTGGTITPDPSASVVHGADSETFTMVADADHYVQDVLVDGQSVGVRWEHSFGDVSGNHTLTAVFGVKPPLPVTDGLGMWVAADAIGAMADGQPVRLWQDLSGNGRHAEQLASGRQPIFTTAVTNILNGYGAVRFDGVDDILPFDGTFLAGTDYTVFIVEGRRSAKANNYLIAGGVSLAGNNLHLGYRANAQLTHDHWGNGHNIWVPGYDQQEFMVYAFRLESPIGREMWWNGGRIGTNADATYLVSNEGATIGGGRAVPAYSDADFAEVIIYTRALTAAEHKQVGRYLQDKYALAASYRAPTLEVGNPVLWVAGDQIPNRVDGETVLTWPDLSGTGHHLTKDVGNPILVDGELNGKPVVRFDGTDPNYMYWSPLTTIRTVFWVVREDPLAAGPRFLLGDSANYHFHRAGEGVIWATYPPQEPVTTGTTKLNGAVINGATTALPDEWVILSLRTTGNVTASRFSRDRNIDGRNWMGDLAELIVYDRELTDEEEFDVGVYLRKKYEIDSDYTVPGMVLIVR